MAEPTPVITAINDTAQSISGLDVLTISKLGVQGILAVVSGILWRKTGALEKKHDDTVEKMLNMERSHSAQVISTAETFRKTVEDTLRPQIQSNMELHSTIKQLYEHNLFLHRKSKLN